MLQFNAKDSRLTLNGHQYDGLSEDEDAISFDGAVEITTTRRGALGQLFSAQSGEDGGMVVVKLLPTSPSTAFMFSQRNRIQAGEIPNDWNGTFTNERLGISVSIERAVLKTAPTGPAVGKGTARNETFEFEAERLTPNYDGAGFTL